MASLASVIFTDYRRRVLGLLMLNPQARYHVREIARLTGTVPGSVHRDLTLLASAGLLTRQTVGKQVYYQANQACPIFDEVASILRKTSAMNDVLANALAPLINKIDVAFIFGSLASGSETTHSDVDVLIIGDVTFAQIVEAFYSTQNLLKRDINPKIFNKKEWQQMLIKKDAFVKEILIKPKLFIVGSLNDLKKLDRQNA